VLDRFTAAFRCAPAQALKHDDEQKPTWQKGFMQRSTSFSLLALVLAVDFLGLPLWVDKLSNLVVPLEYAPLAVGAPAVPKAERNAMGVLVGIVAGAHTADFRSCDTG